MKVVIKRSTDIKVNLKKVSSIKKVGKLKANEFCGIIKLKDSPLEIQKQLRNEW